MIFKNQHNKIKCIVEFISNKNSAFKVSIYQKKWIFNRKIKTLLDDIEEFIKNRELDYFLGSIVIKKDKSLNSNCILADGQKGVIAF